jgi:arabinan endo-1,5-alpha-L-arabinosidase
MSRYRIPRRVLLVIPVVGAALAASAVTFNAQAAEQPSVAAGAAEAAAASPLATQTTPSASYPGPGVIAGATATHDPTMVKTPAGTYIVAQTGDNIPLSTSADRTTFRAAGAAFPNGAPWTTPYTRGSLSLWAPDISYHNGQYYLYYSASTFGENHSAIFLATSPTGASGTWTNRGLVVESTTVSDFNAIDPNLIVDDAGHWWLTFGSFWSGIEQIALDPTTGLRSGTSMRLIASRGNGGAIEAPYMFKHGSYYYLWVSFDRCCRGAASTYRIMVGRSTSPNGPFVDRNGTAMTAGGGTQVLAGHGSIHGPGHQAVLADTDAEVLVYHYYADNGASLLGLNLLGYDSAGWPFIY